MPGPDIHERYLELLRKSGEAEEHGAGEVIFAEGERGEVMYLVTAGTVALETDGRVLELVGPGALFGEMALIDGEPRSATARVESDCELIAIGRRRFWFLVQETPYFAEIVMRVMAERLRRET